MAFSDQGSSDFKQHLNLSDSAWNIIEYDRFRFSSEYGTQLKLSTFLNHVFTLFYPIADASIARRIAEYRKDLTESLFGFSGNSGKSEAKRLIDRLVEERARLLKEKIHDNASGTGKKFRLNAANFSYLTGTDFTSGCNEEKYYSSIGKYLKAVFEEYARLTHLEREAIYYRDILNTILQAKKLGQAVKILHVRDYLFEYKVYDVMSDQNSAYHYLVGYSTPLLNQSDSNIYGDQVRMKPGPSSMRLSNIKMAAIMDRSGKLKKSELQAVESRLSTNGPDFMSEAPQRIVVYLTDQGIASYNYQLSIRPKYTKIIDRHYYVFHCTARQITYYFIAFGPNARIVSPIELRDRFASTFESAYSMQGNILEGDAVFQNFAED